jgi:hypothetical protein
MRNTEVVTGKVRFSYLNVFTPKAQNPGDAPKYSVKLLIPKTDTTTIQKIKAAMAAAREAFVAANGANSLPAQPQHTLRDGDAPKADGSENEPECKGCWVINVSAKADRKPGGYDAFRNDITDPSELKSGDYGRAHINFYGYNRNGNRGISAGLLGVQKLADGEALGGSVATASAFDDGFADGDDDGFLS